eukprot:5993341-Pyramimonas_sp.AAC.2
MHICSDIGCGSRVLDIRCSMDPRVQQLCGSIFQASASVDMSALHQGMVRHVSFYTSPLS